MKTWLYQMSSKNSERDDYLRQMSLGSTTSGFKVSSVFPKASATASDGTAIYGPNPKQGDHVILFSLVNQSSGNVQSNEADIYGLGVIVRVFINDGKVVKTIDFDPSAPTSKLKGTPFRHRNISDLISNIAKWIPPGTMWEIDPGAATILESQLQQIG